MLAPFVAGQPVIRIEAAHGVERQPGGRTPGRATIARKPVRVLRPEPVHHEAELASGRALLACLGGAAGRAEPGRPGQRQHVEIEIAGRSRAARRSRPAPRAPCPPAAPPDRSRTSRARPASRPRICRARRADRPAAARAGDAASPTRMPASAPPNEKARAAPRHQGRSIMQLGAKARLRSSPSTHHSTP